MAGGKEVFEPLRTLYRNAECRRFRARHRTNRYADLLGFTPDGQHVLGFWDGCDTPQMFDPDDLNWTGLITYI